MFGTHGFVSGKDSGFWVEGEEDKKEMREIRK